MWANCSDVDCAFGVCLCLFAWVFVQVQRNTPWVVPGEQYVRGLSDERDAEIDALRTVVAKDMGVAMGSAESAVDQKVFFVLTILALNLNG